MREAQVYAAIFRFLQDIIDSNERNYTQQARGYFASSTAKKMSATQVFPCTAKLDYYCKYIQNFTILVHPFNQIIPKSTTLLTFNVIRKASK